MKMRPSADSTVFVVTPRASPISSFEEPSATAHDLDLAACQVDRLAPSLRRSRRGPAAACRTARRAPGRCALADEPGRAQAHGGVEVLRIVVRGEDDDGGSRRQLLHDRETALVAQANVEQDDVRRRVRGPGARVPCRGRPRRPRPRGRARAPGAQRSRRGRPGGRRRPRCGSRPPPPWRRCERFRSSCRCRPLQHHHRADHLARLTSKVAPICSARCAHPEHAPPRRPGAA